MKYKKIHNLEQYNKYCNIHEELFSLDDEKNQDEIDLLEILIDEYDNRIQKEAYVRLNPVELLKSLIINSDLNQVTLAKKIKISRQLLSDILNYRRNISKEVVEKLAKFFSMSKEAFSRKYDLQQNRSELLKRKSTIGNKIEVIKEIEITKPVDSNPLRSMMDNVEDINVSKSNKVDIDNLKLIEGIGPKIESLLHAEKITTFKKLSKTDIGVIKAILKKAGPLYTLYDPTLWQKQAAIAAKGDWVKFKNMILE